MSAAVSHKIKNLRESLEKRRTELNRLDRERKRVAKQLDSLSNQINQLSRSSISRTDRALLDSVVGGELRAVEKLLAADANPNARNEEGQTALLLAVQARAPKSIVITLLEAGADVDGSDSDGNTPLIACAANEQIAVISALVDHGANVNAANTEGDTPLSNAACWGSSKVAKFLLDHGADPLQPDGAGVLPFALARQQGHPRLARLLEQAARSGSTSHPDPAGRRAGSSRRS